MDRSLVRTDQSGKKKRRGLSSGVFNFIIAILQKYIAILRKNHTMKNVKLIRERNKTRITNGGNLVKKKVALILMLTAALCLVFGAAAYAETKTVVLRIGDPNMSVNGLTQEIDPARGTKPVIVNGRTLLPIRALVENMGATIAWNGDTREVTITTATKTIIMTIDYNQARVKDMNSATADWVVKTLDVPPTIINSRTMMPVRFITEELGAQVGWEAATQTVTITFTSGAIDQMSWTGTWDAGDGGLFIFNQSGNNVATVQDNDMYGRITGTVSGNVLTGKWFIDVGQQGDIVFTMSEDGKTFVGDWKFNYPGFEVDPEDENQGWWKNYILGQRN